MEPPPEHHITVISDSEDSPCCAPDRLARVLSAVFKGESLPAGTANLSIVSDAEIAALNQQFRGICAPTDVLTFVDGQSGHLADIAISFETAARQAHQRNVTPDEELAMLAIHAGLHVAGFDDTDERSQRDMVARMNVYAIQLEIPTDYEWWSRHYGEADVREAVCA